MNSKRRIHDAIVGVVVTAGVAPGYYVDPLWLLGQRKRCQATLIAAQGRLNEKTVPGTIRKWSQAPPLSE